MLEGNILTPQGWVLGRLHIQDGRIQRIEGEPCDPAGNADPYLLPGFIDLHVHGGGGRDIMEGGDAFATIARTHRRFGTTSLLATTMTAPREEIADILSQLGAYCRRSLEGGSRILGVHLEGPYINSGKLGAQPNFAHAAVLEEVEDYLRRAPIRVITIAPEIAGHRPLIRALAERGVRLQIGHTLGSYEDGVAALEAGASSFTHLYNAMTGLHHREPGIVGAALAHARYAELIPDLLHVHPGAIRVALRSIPCLYCVTDSTAAAGLPTASTSSAATSVTKCLGGVRLPDGTLAGSTLTMDQALRNLVKIGLPLAEASQRLSQFPRRLPRPRRARPPGARSLGRCGAPGSLPGTRRRDGGRENSDDFADARSALHRRRGGEPSTGRARRLPGAWPAPAGGRSDLPQALAEAPAGNVEARPVDGSPPRRRGALPSSIQQKSFEFSLPPSRRRVPGGDQAHHIGPGCGRRAAARSAGRGNRRGNCEGVARLRPGAGRSSPGCAAPGPWSGCCRPGCRPGRRTRRPGTWSPVAAELVIGRRACRRRRWSRSRSTGTGSNAGPP